MRLLLISSLCLGLLVACQSRKPEQTYVDHAKALYTEGLEALEDDNFPEAIKQFTQVKNRYPYTQYAALSELRIGDTYYAQDSFNEAVNAYLIFTRRRPNHPDVSYAMWRIGDSYDQQRPSGFFLLPPAYERDRSTTHDAVRSYRAYLQRFPQGKQAAKVQSRLSDCRGALADYEMYVAEFYLRDGRHRSAIGRLEAVFREYGELRARWRRASALLVASYVQVARRMSGEAKDQIEKDDAAEMLAKGRRVFQALSEKYPKSQETGEARLFLERAGQSLGEPGSIN